MPRGDRTGPSGMGQMTGRGLGFCSGYETPGYTRGFQRGGAGFGGGFGRGFGRGYGRGFANWGYQNYPAPQYSAKDESQYLESEVNALKNELKALETRLSELNKDE